MALVTSENMLKSAMNQHYAVPAFNANSLEMIPALITAAESEAAPIIIQIGRKYLTFTPPDEIGALAIYLAKKASVPVCIHLDHGFDVKMVKDCLDAGFTSIMYDGSAFSEEENIYNTKEVVELARLKNIPVEGEIGQVLMEDQIANIISSDFFSDPVGTKRFVDETNVSSVAVSVGNIHRMRTKQAKLDFDLIRKIKREVSIPLVIHGSSGISDTDIKKAIECGISKVNVATELSVVFTDKIRDYMQKYPSEFFPMEIIKPAMEEVTKLAQKRIKVLGANKKA